MCLSEFYYYCETQTAVIATLAGFCYIFTVNCSLCVFMEYCNCYNKHTIREHTAVYTDNRVVLSDVRVNLFMYATPMCVNWLVCQWIVNGVSMIVSAPSYSIRYDREYWIIGVKSLHALRCHTVSPRYLKSWNFIRLTDG